MGLLGIARGAGRARGAYMAEMENYHRQRQGLYDDMALRRFGMDQQRFDMDRRKFNEDLVDREAKRKRDAETHQWAGETHKDNLTTNIYRRDALRAQERSHNAQTQAVENRTKREDEIYKNYTSPYNGLMLELAKGRLDAQDYSNEQNEINRQRQNAIYNQRMAAMNRMSPQERDNYLLYGANRYNPSLAQMTGTRSGRKSAGKPAVSDTRLKAAAKAVTPEQMQMAFSQQFYDTDDNILKKTGMKRDQFIRTLADQYRAHILSAGENMMSEDDFIRQAAGRFGFWDRDDLGRLMTSMNDARSKNPTKHGFGWFGFGRRNAEEEYARRNPAFYKKQRQIIDDVFAIKGINPQFKNEMLSKPDFVRHYRKATEKGLSPDEAFRYGVDAIRRGAR